LENSVLFHLDWYPKYKLAFKWFIIVAFPLQSENIYDGKRQLTKKKNKKETIHLRIFFPHGPFPAAPFRNQAQTFFQGSLSISDQDNYEKIVRK